MYTPTNSQENEPRATPSPTVGNLSQLTNELLIIQRHQAGIAKAMGKVMKIIQELVE